eukprot:scaffold285691_cov17-Prasinocladus_malaysianus.AAC.1
MQPYSKLNHRVGGDMLGPAACISAVAVVFLLNSSRKRRREGGEDVVPGRFCPGGRGKSRRRVERQARYSDKLGKVAWQLDPTRTQWYLNYIENAHLAEREGTVLNKEFRHKFRIPYN